MNIASFRNGTSAPPPPPRAGGPVHDDLVRFLRGHFATGARTIVLAQCKANASMQPVEQWQLDDGEDAASLAEVIRDVVAREVDAIRATSTYAVLALAKHQSDAVGRYLFRVDAGFGWRTPAETKPETAVIELAIAQSDQASKLALGQSQGIFEQYERLNEQTHKHYGKLLEDLWKRITLLEGREHEALELRERMQSLATERERSLSKDQHRASLQNRAFDAFMGVLGQVVMRAAPSVLGANASPTPARAPGASATPNDERLLELVEQFVASLEPAQVNAFRASLHQAQIALLFQVFTLVNERFEARKAEGAQAASPAPADAPSESSSPVDSPAPVDSHPKGTPS